MRARTAAQVMPLDPLPMTIASRSVGTCNIRTRYYRKYIFDQSCGGERQIDYLVEIDVDRLSKGEW
tara:strand:- start:686 stop:883 length:198 start_codon:yes stop_codon:yes gene_type:complete